MVGNICLDKAKNEDGEPAPIKFGLQEVKNGNIHPTWSGKRCYATLKQAMSELYKVFLLEMEDRNYEFRVNGEPYYLPLNDGTDKFSYLPYQGETGWYDLNNPSNGPDLEYPGTESEWLDHRITGYSYDNYKVLIVTSNGDVVY